MPRLVSRYTHLPLAAASILLLLTIIFWLLDRRGDGIWHPGLRLAAPVVAVPPSPSQPAPAQTAPAGPSASPTAATLARLPRSPGPSASRGSPPRPAARAERYVLESGPFASAEAADHLEDRLNHLGHATVRFRKQDATRLYIVAAVGFASTAEARETASQIGRGAVIESAGGAEILVDRLPSLGEAVAAARPLRARGLEVRVSEAISPTAIYHIRYGQFGSRSQAQTSSAELARSGIKNRVVKVASAGDPSVTVRPRRVGSGAPRGAVP